MTIEDIWTYSMNSVVHGLLQLRHFIPAGMEHEGHRTKVNELLDLFDLQWPDGIVRDGWEQEIDPDTLPDVDFVTFVGMMIPQMLQELYEASQHLSQDDESKELERVMNSCAEILGELGLALIPGFDQTVIAMATA